MLGDISRACGVWVSDQDKKTRTAQLPRRDHSDWRKLVATLPFRAALAAFMQATGPRGSRPSARDFVSASALRTSHPLLCRVLFRIFPHDSREAMLKAKGAPASAMRDVCSALCKGRCEPQAQYLRRGYDG